MLIDSRELAPGASVQTKVCIIGAGAAGITIARELARAGIPAVLLESGGFSFDGPTQALYRGESEGLTEPDYLETSRLRFFGGSTNHWGGNCRPLDPIDFEAKAWMPDSGWPIGREDLDPFYPEAARLCQLGPFKEYVHPPASVREAMSAIPKLERVEPTLFQTGPPTRFGIVYRDELVASDSLHIYTYANVLRLETDADGLRVTHVEATSLGGPRFRIDAEQFVLATGGIENARILLLSDRVHRNGLGNREDQVGRWFAGHPAVLGSAYGCFWRSPRQLALFAREQPREPDGSMRSAVFTLGEQVERVQQLRNGGIVLKPLRKKHRLLSILGQDESQWEAVCTTASAVDGYRSGQGSTAISTYRLRVKLEIAPNPDNRVTLDRDQRDANGQPRAHLRWEASSDDLNSMWRMLEIFAHDVAKAGFGRVRLNRGDGDWSVHPDKHHMGTTRMHASPRRGVVDADCRVHGVDNLFVAGSSVFPSYGYANPTLTLVALALRLSRILGRT